LARSRRRAGCVQTSRRGQLSFWVASTPTCGVADAVVAALNAGSALRLRRGQVASLRKNEAGGHRGMFCQDDLMSAPNWHVALVLPAGLVRSGRSLAPVRSVAATMALSAIRADGAACSRLSHHQHGASRAAGEPAFPPLTELFTGRRAESRTASLGTVNTTSPAFPLARCRPRHCAEHRVVGFPSQLNCGQNAGAGAESAADLRVDSPISPGRR